MGAKQKAPVSHALIVRQALGKFPHGEEELKW